MRRTRCNPPARVKIEQLDGHLLDCRLRSIALLSPSLPTERMQSRRRIVRRYVGRGSESFDLIDSIQWNVQSRAALVFDHRGFNRALAHKDFFYTAIDADAVLEMNHIVAGCECGH